VTDLSASRPQDFVVSWDRFHSDAKALALLLRDKGPFTLLIAVARGGLIPTAIVARELNLRCIETISIASYDEKVRGRSEVLKALPPDILTKAEKGQILVIDDLADSGQTSRLLRGLLPSAHLATLYVKPAAKSLVDTFVQEVPQASWIYFPWDLGLRFEPPLVEGG
jgi:xanthine phosphoribosyltransferase